MSHESHEQLKRGPEWIRPSFDEEAGEFEGISEHFGIPMNVFRKAFDNAALEDLDSDTWSQLQNADSRDESWTFEEIKEWLESRMINDKDESRDVESLINGFDLQNRIPTPIVLFRTGEPPYLVAGNSRLLIARVKKLVPKILALRLEEF